MFILAQMMSSYLHVHVHILQLSGCLYADFYAADIGNFALDHSDFNGGSC